MPVLVTLISTVLGLEPPTMPRYVAIGIDMTMVIISLVLRLVFGFSEYGENAEKDKWYLLYIMIVIFSISVQFVLTKLLLLSSPKLNLLTFAFWVYLFGTIGTVFLYCIECLWARNGDWTIDDIPRMLQLVEEVIFVFLFSCANEIINYILLLHFLRKTLVTKASVYGILASIYIIFVTIFTGGIKSALLWCEIIVFLTGYVIISTNKKIEKLKKKKLNIIKYIEEIDVDERAIIIN